MFKVKVDGVLFWWDGELQSENEVKKKKVLEDITMSFAPIIEPNYPIYTSDITDAKNVYTAMINLYPDIEIIKKGEESTWEEDEFPEGAVF